MAELSPITSAPIQLPQGTTVGLLILQSTATSEGGAPLVSLAPITTTINNNNVNINNNNILPKMSFQKAIKPAPPSDGKQTKAKKSKGSPPLKPPKKERDDDNEIHRCKRRLDFAKLGLPFNRPNPVSVARRNERERKRVKQINSTFISLRDHLPETYCQHKNPNKMSKVETLRGAIDYINSLQDILQDCDQMNAAFTNGVFPKEMMDQAEQIQHDPTQNGSSQTVESPVQIQTISTTESHQHLNQMLAVTAAEVLQLQQQAMELNSLNSPTGSTCSSVSSSISSAGSTGCPTTTASMDYHYDMSYASLPSVQQQYQQHLYQDTSHSLVIEEEDLLEFAKWF